jgi:hypothetical protein
VRERADAWAQSQDRVKNADGGLLAEPVAQPEGVGARQGGGLQRERTGQLTAGESANGIRDCLAQQAGLLRQAQPAGQRESP